MSARQEAITKIEICDNSEGYLFSESGFLKFSPDGKNLLAASNDGAIYKYNYDPSGGLTNISELSSLTLPLNERIGMISVSNSCDLAFASEDHELVKLCRLSEEKFEDPKLVTKTVGKTLALAINPQGTILCCSGTDNITKIINIKNLDFPVLGQIPSSHFVKSISFSENGSLLAFLQIDGMLRIYKVIENNPVPHLVQTLSGIKGNFNENFQVTWKGEDCLGVLYGGKTLRIYQFNSDSDKWEIKNDFSTSSSEIKSFELLSKDLSLISCSDEKISLFSVARNKVLTLTNWEKLEQSSLAAANENLSFIFEPSRGDLFKIKINVNPKDLIVPVDQKEKRKSNLSSLSNSKRIKSKYIDDYAAGDDEVDLQDEYEDGYDSDNVDDDVNDQDQSDELKMNFNDDDDNFSTRTNTFESENESEIESFKSIQKRHPIVQVCCTAWRNLQRYLAYNNYGFITARSSLDNENVFNYDIEFMDRSSNNPVRFEDKISFNMASLSEKGAAFASNGSGACLHYVSLKNSGDSWTIPMSLGTEPILLGMNNNFIYLINDRYIMNIYTLTGLLKSSVMCPGRAISLVCSEEEVFLFTEDSEGILCNRINPKTGGLIPNVASSRVLLYCSKEDSELVWVGSSFTGVLGSFTSKGKFSILLNRDGCGDRWTEILDTNSSSLDKVWPVYFDINVLSGVICKANETYPDPYPSPHVIDINFKIPEISNDAPFEEVFRTNLFLNETNSHGLTEREKKKLFASSDRNLLELAQLSIRMNRFSRLSDLASWSTNEKTVDLLIQLAKHHKLNSIVDEIETIKDEMFKKPTVSTVPTIPAVPAVPAVTNVNPDVTMITMSPMGTNGNTWLTPKLPEMVSKESPSGILANLTPMKTNTSSKVFETLNQSSPLSSNSNPFAKPSNENQNPEISSINEGNAMLDYISTMMKLNGGGGNKKGGSLSQ